jgi:hypothetical protein
MDPRHLTKWATREWTSQNSPLLTPYSRLLYRKGEGEGGKKGTGIVRPEGGEWIVLDMLELPHFP